MSAQRVPIVPPETATAADGFEVLDQCHRQMLAMLDQLGELVSRLAAVGADPIVRAAARAVVDFFSGTSHYHHEDEERHVFPKLATSGDPGLVHDVLSALESLGYIDRLARTSHLTDIHGLALNWAAAFPGGLRRKMEIGVFYSDPHRWPVASSDALLGGEWAVRDLLQPARVTVYTPQIDGPLLSGLRLRTAEQGEANTIVLRRFWQSPTPDQRHSIPWVVTYAELMSSQDARVRTAGHDFFRLHAG